MKYLLKYGISNKTIKQLITVNNSIRRFLSWLVTIAVILSALATYVPVLYANNYNEVENQLLEPGELKYSDYEATTDQSFKQSEIAIEKEVINERTFNTKTFKRVDGSYAVTYYPQVIHYEKDGVLEEIDNTLVYDQSSKYYTNKSNAFQIFLPKSLSETNVFSITKENYRIEWSVINSNASSIQYEPTKKESGNLLELKNITQEVNYIEATPFYDLQYTLIGQKLKENIILNQFVEKTQISFNYKITNLILQYDENKNIAFEDELGNTIFAFENLFMIDAKGDISTDIQFSISNQTKDEFQFTIIPNKDWLKKATYPVVIDPSITVLNADYFDTYVSSENPNYNNHANNYLMIRDQVNPSYKNYGLISFNMPDAIATSNNKMVTYAHLRLEDFDDTNSNEDPLGLYENIDFFQNSSVTWNTKPNFKINPVDYAYAYTINDTSFYSFDITKTVAKWHENNDYYGPNFLVMGFTIAFMESNNVRFLKSDEVTLPCLEIGYMDIGGIKDYWTYNSQSVGFAGTSYISDYTGMLTFVRNEFNFRTDLQTLGLSFVYSVNNRNENIGYGKGWKTNYHIRVISPSLSNENTYFIIDGTGNKVYYHYLTSSYDIENPSGPYEDYYQAEDGSGNILSIKYNAHPGVLTGYEQISPNGTKSVFDDSGYLTSIIINNEGATPTTLTIEYVSGNKDQILEVTDTAGNSIVLGYSSSGLVMSRLRLKDVNNYNRYVEKANYSYTNETLTKVEYSKSYECEGIYASDGYIDYTYQNYKLISAKDSDGNEIVFQYDSFLRVLNISSFVNNSLFGELDYVYSFKRTKISDQDNNFMWFSFDAYGHTVNMLDSRGNVSFKRYLNLFKDYDDINEENRQLYINLNGSPNYDNNHKLIEASSPQHSIFNPFRNSNFEYELNDVYGWNFYNGGNSNSIASITSSQFFMGEKSLSITTTNNVEAKMIQGIRLDSGTYTISAYVKNTGMGSAGIRIQSYGNVTNVISTNSIASNDSFWRQVNISIDIIADDTLVEVVLFNDTNGVAYFDCVQLAVGYIDTRINFVDNPSFEIESVNGNLPSSWSFLSVNVTWEENFNNIDEPYYNILDNRCLKISGNPKTPSRALGGIYYDIDNTNGDKHIILGGWAFSEATPITYVPGAPNRFFRIRLDVRNSNNVITNYYLDFDPSVEGWQYALKDIALTQEDILDLTIYCEYQGLGNVYFDGIQAYEYNLIEAIANTYQYDECGRNIWLENNSYIIITHYVNSPNAISEDPSLDKAKIEYKEIYNKETQTTITQKLETNELGQESVLIEENTLMTIVSKTTYGQATQIRFGDLSNSYYNASTTYLSTSNYSAFNHQYIASSTNEFNKTTNYHYNLLNGLLKAIEEPNDTNTLYLYDNRGRVIQTIKTNDYNTYVDGSSDFYSKIIYQYSYYDNNNNYIDDNKLHKIILSNGNTYTFGYDNENRLTNVQVNNTNLISYVYAMEGSFYTSRVSKQTYGNNDQMQFLYNDNDLLEYVTFKDASDNNFINKFHYIYDNNSRVVVFEIFDETGLNTYKTEYYSYDQAGNLFAITDDENNCIFYTYDSEGNLTGLTFNILNKEHFVSYDYYTQFNKNGNTYNLKLYDKTEYTVNNNQNILKDYQYEDTALQRLQAIVLSVNNNPFIEENYSYQEGAANYNTRRITSVIYNITGINNDITINYQYDSMGNIKKYQYFVESIKLYVYDYQYDELNQLQFEDIWQSNDDNYTNYYIYDLVGNIITKYRIAYQERLIPETNIAPLCDPVGAIEVLINGKDYRYVHELNIGETPSLTFMFYNPDTSTEYTIKKVLMLDNTLNTSVEGFYYREYLAVYAPVSIIFRVLFKVGDPIVDGSHYNYSSTWSDLLISYDVITSGVTHTTSYTYDESGNPILITNFIYKGIMHDEAILSWDGRSLKSIIVKDNFTTFATITYTYNDEGIRIKKVISEGLIETVTDYYLSGDKVIVEKTNNNVILYTYDVDGTLISFNYLETEYFYVKDILGNVISIININGNVLVEYQYDAYGNIINIIDNSGVLNLSRINSYRYRSYRYDEEISYYYCNARYYSSLIGRWLNADHVSFLDSSSANGLNLFVYCENNPVMYCDPSGKFAILLTVLGLIIGAVIGATAGGVIAYNVAKNNGAEGWELFGWTMLGIVGGGIIGGALGAGIGVLVTKATGIIGLSITKYSIIPIKSVTILGNIPTYSAAAIATGSGYYEISNKLYNSLSSADRLANNLQYLADANSLGSKFAIIPEYVVEFGYTLWEEINYLLQNGIPYIIH